MSGANPLVAGSPDIDVNTTFKITENKIQKTVHITASQTGDRFPAAETFIQDTKGKSVFIGVSPYTGNPYTSLPGANNRKMFSSDFIININDKGEFQSVLFNGVVHSIDDWNKRNSSTDVKSENETEWKPGGGSGFDGGGSDGGWNLNSDLPDLMCNDGHG